MKIVWDEPKRLANIAKHGLDFADLDVTFFDAALVQPTHNNRYRAIGPNVHGVISVVFATLGKEGISLISMRPARKDERKLYEQEQEKR